MSLVGFMLFRDFHLFPLATLVKFLQAVAELFVAEYICISAIV